jgi:hypothetical protein
MNADASNREIEVLLDRRRLPRRLRRAGDPATPPAPRIPRITRLMALAIKFDEMIRRGEVKDYADLARLGYVTRARITQIMNLLNLAPEIQEQLLSLPKVSPGRNPITERHLRQITCVPRWEHQCRLWKQLPPRAVPEEEAETRESSSLTPRELAALPITAILPRREINTKKSLAWGDYGKQLRERRFNDFNERFPARRQDWEVSHSDPTGASHAA